MNNLTPQFRNRPNKLDNGSMHFFKHPKKSDSNPRARSNSNQIRSPTLPKEAVFSNRKTKRLTLNPRIKNYSKQSTPKELSDSESEITSKFMSSQARSPISLPENSRTHILTQQIKESLAELREEADNYMNSSQKAFSEFSHFSKQIDTKISKSGMDLCDTSPNEYHLLEQLKAINDDIQVMQTRLSENELKLYAKRQENSKLKELLGNLIQNMNERKATSLEKDSKTINCTAKCEIM
ncbi:unnamed protein product [Blepharisma stoltei]|uniref:Uncharacterized protein n=1 Tax=Blepharisma stoltei TaxID=1481888 RepID=A0AAU9JPF9_9CILI|nr:unnamed protein product [Blepharisma stoltei]